MVVQGSVLFGVQQAAFPRPLCVAGRAQSPPPTRNNSLCTVQVQVPGRYSVTQITVSKFVCKGVRAISDIITVISVEQQAFCATGLSTFDIPLFPIYEQNDRTFSHRQVPRKRNACFPHRLTPAEKKCKQFDLLLSLHLQGFTIKRRK